MIRDIAPEVVDGDEPSEAADVYQFGAMLTHLMRERPGSRPPATPELRQASQRMRTLFTACLAPKPRNRPTAVGVHDELAEVAVSLGAEPAAATRTTRVRQRFGRRRHSPSDRSREGGPSHDSACPSI